MGKAQNIGTLVTEQVDKLSHQSPQPSSVGEEATAKEQAPQQQMLVQSQQQRQQQSHPKLATASIAADEIASCHGSASQQMGHQPWGVMDL